MDVKLDFKIIEIAGREILAKILDLRAELPASGNYPFIIGDKRELERVREGHSYYGRETTAEEIIRKSYEINVEKLFDERKNSALPSAEENEFDIAHLTGEWEERDSPREIGLYFDDFIRAHMSFSTKAPYETCYIGIAPTTESWQIPALTRFGSWNACPKPEEHCAILRYWQEKYQAEIISLTGDVIECRAGKPPQTEAEVWQLAWEQFAYCADIVDQGLGTVGALASNLRDSDYWYFWWD